MSSIEEKEKQQRKEIIESQQFHEWLRNREQIQPTPSNPYQAFMIDRSLKAKPYDKESWSDYVNRSDHYPIDSFRKGYDEPGPAEPSPPIHRKHRQETFVPSTKIRPKHEEESLHKELISHKEEFIKTYNLTDVDVIVEKREGSAYRHPLMGGKGQLLVPEHFYQAVQKESYKQNVKKQWEAINTHELGHHAQFAYGGGYEAYTTKDTEPRSGSLKEIYQKTESQPTKMIRREKFAWDVAKDFYAKKGKKFKGSTKLVENWAFGTYVGTTPKSMQGPNAKFSFDVTKQLIVRRKDAKGSIWGKQKK